MAKRVANGYFGPHISSNCRILVRPAQTDGSVDAVTSNPKTCTDKGWKRLMARPFGEVIFSSQGVALPESMAAGDLDGDFYYGVGKLELSGLVYHWSINCACPCPIRRAP